MRRIAVNPSRWRKIKETCQFKLFFCLFLSRNERWITIRHNNNVLRLQSSIPKALNLCPASALGWCNSSTADLNVDVHQLGLAEQVVDLPCFQPAVRFLLLPAQVDEDHETAFSVVQSGPVRPENMHHQHTSRKLALGWMPGRKIRFLLPLQLVLQAAAFLVRIVTAADTATPSGQLPPAPYIHIFSHCTLCTYF